MIGAWFTLTVSTVETTGTRYVAFGGVVVLLTANPSTAGTKLHVAWAGSPVQVKSTPP